MPKKIILASFGNLGNIHPFIAIALSLKAHGFDPLLAVPETQLGSVLKSNIEKIESAGLKAVPIFPDFERVGRTIGIKDVAEAARMIITDTDFVLREIELRFLDESARALDAVSEGAAAIVGSTYEFSAPIIAEKRKIPFIPAILSPMLLLSPNDPAKSPDLWMLLDSPKSALGRAWNRACVRLIRMETLRRYGPAINRVRREHGLAPLRRSPIFGLEIEPPIRLALYSALLHDSRAALPADTCFTGFPVFDSEAGAIGNLPDALRSFLSAGPPPLVFTMGSIAVYASGAFYPESAKAARALGMRAVLLTGRDEPASESGDILACRYAPLSRLLPGAAAVIHHGGIGSIGQALKAGRPQLVVPHNADQFDNARRMQRLGVGDVLPAKGYSAMGVQAKLSTILANRAMKERARQIAQQLKEEDGAGAAAEAIISILK